MRRRLVTSPDVSERYGQFISPSSPLTSSWNSSASLGLLVACTFSSSLQSTLNSDTNQAQSLVNSGELAPAVTA